jgi:hypothetical protein
VATLAVAAGAGGAAAGCHPTGTPIVDPVYSGLLAASVTLAASRAGRGAVLLFAAIGMALSRQWLLVPGVAALTMAFTSVLLKRRYRRLEALIGGLAIQVVLRWPSLGFHGVTALVAGISISICLVSAYRHLRAGQRRWVRRSVYAVAVLLVVGSVPAAYGALQARTSADRGIAATDAAISSVSQGRTTSAGSGLATATADFTAVSTQAGAWWTSGARLVPIVAQQRRALLGAAEAGRSVLAAASGAAATIDLRSLPYSHGRIDLAHIRSLGPPLSRLQARMAAAQGRLTAIQSPWLVGPIRDPLRRLDGKLSEAQDKAGLAAQVVRTVPAILGGDGVRHYLIAFMTPSESRGLDGFIGAYGELRVDNGRITLVRSGRVTDLNHVAAGSRHITGPADYLARYGNFDPANHFQDLSYAPDFPTVAQVIAQMYPQSGGDHIDGVLALDPAALAALLELTGPVTVPGRVAPLSSTNAAAFLLEGEYDQYGNANAARHDFLQEALSAAFGRLLDGRLPPARTLGADLAPVARQGRLLFWTDRPTEQPLLRRLDLAGAFPQTPGRDVLAVTTQNAANNKIDAYLHRAIVDNVRFNPATGQTTSSTRITLHNAAPARGLPHDVLGSFAGSGLRAGTNRTWMSVYSPLALVGATENGAQLLMTPVPELGITTYSAYIDIGPGQTVTIDLRLAGHLTPGATYQLSLRDQPMVNPDQVTAHVSPTPGWTGGFPAAAPTPATEDTEKRARFARFS